MTLGIATAVSPSVALFARAWIEIGQFTELCITNNVALFARAWIEIWVENYEDLSDDTSPSLRGRGLKSQVADLFSLCTSSPSLRGRGLKCHYIVKQV